MALDREQTTGAVFGAVIAAVTAVMGAVMAVVEDELWTDDELLTDDEQSVDRCVVRRPACARRLSFDSAGLSDDFTAVSRLAERCFLKDVTTEN
jgi:hypothetical protein